MRSPSLIKTNSGYSTCQHHPSPQPQSHPNPNPPSKKNTPKAYSINNPLILGHKTHIRNQQLMTTSNQNLSFSLSDGIIEVSDEKLIITDKAKNDRLLLLVTSMITIMLSLSIIYKWFIARETYYLVVGSILLIPNIGLLWKWYKEFRFVESTIKFSDILKLQIVNIKFSGTKVGLIQLKNLKVRRVKMEYRDLVAFSDFIDTIKAK